MTPKIVSQRDPRWSGIHLGSTGMTMGSSGCLVSAVDVVLGVYGIDVDPGTLCNQYNAIGAFGSTGKEAGMLSSWRTSEIYPQIAPKITSEQTNIKGRQGKDINQMLVAIKAMLDAGKPVILQVDLSPYNGRDEGDHFVTAYDWNGGDIKIIDPWFGLDTTLATPHPATANDQAFKGYGKPEDSIYGFRVLSLVNSSQPDMPNEHINLPDNCLVWHAEGSGEFGRYDSTKDILYVDDTAKITAVWLNQTKGNELDPRTQLTSKQWYKFSRHNLKDELLK